MLYFVTGNRHKFAEAQAVMPDLEQLDVDLTEVQHLDPKVVIGAKLAEAAKTHNGEFIVEDTSLALRAMGGFPGTFVKWMIDAVDLQRMYELTNGVGEPEALARTMIGYRPAEGQPVFFEGITRGVIVPPKGSGFGFDPIFQPEGYDQTFGQMTAEQKLRLSMRTEAFMQLRDHLDQTV